MPSLIVLGIGCALAILGIIKPRLLVLAVVFLAPWQGLDPDIGVRVTAYQLALAALVGITVFRGRLWGPVNLFLAALIAYAVIRTLFQVPFLPSTGEIEGGILRAQGVRPFVQIVVLLLNLCPILLSIWWFHRISVLDLGRVYVLSCAVLALIGWGQLAIWYSTGSNPLPIGYVDTLLGGRLGQLGLAYEGTFSVGDIAVHRMNSFGGEPKNLGQAIAVAILMLQAAMLVEREFRTLRVGAVLLCLFLTMLATTSASAIYLWLLGTATLSVALSLTESRASVFTHWQKLTLMFVATIVLLIVGVYYDDIAESLPVTEAFLGQILLEQLVTRGVIEDFDAAIWDFLFDNPTALIAGVGLGNAHLYANVYLAPAYAEYASGTAFTAKSGYLRVLSELGLIGLCLFLGWVTAELVRLKTRLQRGASIPTSMKTQGITLVGFGWVMLLCFLIRGDYVAQQFYITFGVVVAMLLSLKREFVIARRAP